MGKRVLKGAREGGRRVQTPAFMSRSCFVLTVSLYLGFPFLLCFLCPLITVGWSWSPSLSFFSPSLYFFYAKSLFLPLVSSFSYSRFSLSAVSNCYSALVIRSFFSFSELVKPSKSFILYRTTVSHTYISPFLSLFYPSLTLSFLSVSKLCLSLLYPSLLL